MRMPLTVRRGMWSEPASAFLVRSDRAADALTVLERLAAGPAGLPTVLEVRGGFLLTTEEPLAEPVPGALRLREASRHLYIPVDAQIAPALLSDEAEGLVSRYGLVLLPGGEALAFDPNRPLKLSALLTIERSGRSPWDAPPTRPSRAERIVELLWDAPEETADTILRAGGDGIGSGADSDLDGTDTPGDSSENEAPEREPGPGLGRRTVGRAAEGLGQGLKWIGATLGMRGLANLGSRAIERAREFAPQIHKTAITKQERALRDLLKEFRSGNVESALRRALPIGRDGGRGARHAPNADLPDCDASYSLPDLLAGSRSGTPSYWIVDRDVHEELAREYRKAALQAARRGDYRRAAYIHAKLLEDYRSAANVLLQGGLARDAGRIYLEKLHDREMAAQAFEAAGDLDQALSLYRAARCHERAGDLLRRLGEPEDAANEYERAAERLVLAQGDYLQAGELLRTKASRPDRAAHYFALGWARFDTANAVDCGLALARLEAQRGSGDAVLALLDEADSRFARPGRETACARFYNGVRDLADQPSLAPRRDDLLDRVRVGLAKKLREVVDTHPYRPDPSRPFFPTKAGWPVGLIRDAEHASRTPRGLGRPIESLQVGGEAARRSFERLTIETLTAVSAASAAGALFLGTEGGTVWRVELDSGRSSIVGSYNGPVASVAADPDGQTAAVVWYLPRTARGVVARYRRQGTGGYHVIHGSVGDFHQGPPSLVPNLDPHSDIFGLWDGRRYELFRGGAAIPFEEIDPFAETTTDETAGTQGESKAKGAVEDEAAGFAEAFGAHLALNDSIERPALLLTNPADSGVTLIEMAEHGLWVVHHPASGTRAPLDIPWIPDLREAPLWEARLGYPVARAAALAIVGASGRRLYQTRLIHHQDRWEHVETTMRRIDRPLRALAFASPRRLVAADERWVREVSTDPSDRFRERYRLPAPFPNTIALRPCARTGDLVLISDDGRMARLALPSA